MSQPPPITPGLPPPLIVLTTFAGHLAAITLTTEDRTQLAAQRKATPLPTADQIAAARARGLK